MKAGKRRALGTSAHDQIVKRDEKLKASARARVEHRCIRTAHKTYSHRAIPPVKTGGDAPGPFSAT